MIRSLVRPVTKVDGDLVEQVDERDDAGTPRTPTRARAAAFACDAVVDADPARGRARPGRRARRARRAASPSANAQRNSLTRPPHREVAGRPRSRAPRSDLEVVADRRQRRRPGRAAPASGARLSRQLPPPRPGPRLGRLGHPRPARARSRRGRPRPRSPVPRCQAARRDVDLAERLDRVADRPGRVVVEPGQQLAVGAVAGHQLLVGALRRRRGRRSSSDDPVGQAQRGDAVGDDQAASGRRAPRAAGRRSRSSVAASTALVASSSTRIRGSDRIARASATRCRWPPLRLSPRSPTRVS